MKELEEMRKDVTKEEVEHTMKVLKEDREKAEAKKAKKKAKSVIPKPDKPNIGVTPSA